MTEEQQQAMLDECFECDDHLRASGFLAAGEGPPETALTLYWKNGKVAVTDGPYAETKEQLMGIYVVDVPTFDDAVVAVERLNFEGGVFEITPLASLRPGVVPTMLSTGEDLP